MNTFQLILKQMRQRALSSWLTILSVLLGVALATSVFVIDRQGRQIFSQSDYGYNGLITARGSKLQSVLNVVYNIDMAPGTIPWQTYLDLLEKPDAEHVQWAVPFEVGDGVQGLRVMGVGDLTPFEYARGKKLEIASGSHFAPDKFEGVIGSNVEKIIGLKMGDEFQMEHGGAGSARGEKPDESADIHAEKWKVVGVLKPTGTPLDETIFVPIISTWCIGKHAEFMEEAAKVVGANEHAGHDHDEHAEHDDHEHHDHDHHQAYELVDGRIKLNLHPEDLRITGVFVRTQPSYLNFNHLQFNIEQRGRAMMLNPAQEMRNFFNLFLGPAAKVLSGVAVLTSVLAAVAILVSIYNSVVARRREIAILRALGATRGRVLTLITLEAAMIGIVGGLVGLIVGYLIVGIGISMQDDLRLPVSAISVGWIEWVYLLGVVVLCALAGIVPALKAYRVSVAEGLTGS